MKNKILLLGIIFILLFLFMSLTHFCSNIWGLLTENGYFIPQESNIFSFNATKMNSGYIVFIKILLINLTAKDYLYMNLFGEMITMII